MVTKIQRARVGVAAMVALVGAAASANAVIIPEIEPNDSKATATVANMAVGDVLTGTSTGSTGVGIDTWRVNLGVQPLGIYRNRLVITTGGTAGHTGSIRGVSQVAAPADTIAGTQWDGVVGTPSATSTDIAFQSSVSTTTPARFNQFYSFGNAASFFYRITGGTSTTAPYNVTLEQQQVMATNIGSYAPGQISMNWNGQGHSTDTDMWVYDSNFNPIAGYGNDDSSATLGGAPIPTTSAQSFLARDYAPGIYYVAVTNFNFANELASPSDENFRTAGYMPDSFGIAANSSTAVNLNMTFTITDSEGNSLQVQNTKAGAFDINWFVFEVVPTPGSAILLGMGGLLAARRRRA